MTVQMLPAPADPMSKPMARRMLHRMLHQIVHRMPTLRSNASATALSLAASTDPPAREYARALISYLQNDPALRDCWVRLRECWVSSKALELKFYPEFLAASGWAPLPWLAVSKVLKTVTKKRPKQLMLFKNGKRKRCCVVQFKVPRAARS